MTSTAKIQHVVTNTTMATENTANWYVIHTKPRQERRADENLQRQGFETFLPIYQLEKIQHRKLSLVEEPLFKRYLFIRFDPDNSNWHVIRNTFGVSQLVRLGGQLASVPDEVIQQLMKTAEISQALYKKDAHLLIADGPFQNLKRAIEMHDDDSRAIVLIELLNKTQRISVSLNALAKDI